MNFYHDDDIPDDLKRYFKPAPQIGMEATPDEHVAKLVEVFREVRRVLRNDGVLWLNYGDAYAGGGRFSPDSPCNVARRNGDSWGALNPANMDRHEAKEKPKHARKAPSGLKPKDLIGLPWMLAFALRADGWVLRSEIVWAKPNPMPESVRDRPTKSHEQVFLFSKATWRGAAPGQFAHITDQDARWLAMFIDTEGNICVKRSERGDSGRTQYGIQVAFANTSRALLDAGRAIVGAGSVHERKGKNAPMFYWQIAGKQARDFLHRIYPFLIVKKRQAALGIHVQDVLSTGGKKRPGGFRADEHTRFLETAWARMKSLNHFGTPDLSDVPDPKYGKWDSQPYFYDADAVAETGVIAAETKAAKGSVDRASTPGVNSRPPEYKVYDGIRNLRTVWSVTTEPYPEAHFATFPEALAERCIKAGTSAHGACSKCLSPWERVTEVTYENPGNRSSNGPRSTERRHETAGFAKRLERRSETTGWQPTCDCGEDVTPCVVLDPFAGSGTTLAVSERLGRDSLGIELNPDYIAMAERRIRSVDPTQPIPLKNGSVQGSLFQP